MKLKKGGVYSVRLGNGKYFYIYYITGGVVGDLVKVINYVSSDVEHDVEEIVHKPSLYNDDFIIAFLDHDFNRMNLVGTVRVDFERFMCKSFFTRRSIKCGTIKESFNGDIVQLKKRYTSGEKYIFDDWRLEEHKIVGVRGRFDVVKEHNIGELPEKYLNSFNSMIFPHIDDFEQMLIEGVDRNTMLCSVYQ
jgi:hypothetical protein